MSKRECEFATTVRTALRTGQWTPEVQAHVARCATCAELVSVLRALRAMQVPVRPEHLPDPRSIYWRARVLQPPEAEQRAAWPLVVAQRAALVFALLASLVFLGTRWPRVTARFPEVLEKALHGLDFLVLTGAALRPPLLVFWVTGMVLLGVIVLVTAEFVFAE